MPGNEPRPAGAQNPLAVDLDHILAHTDGLWEELRGKRIFITGGTGFFGCWLLESFAWANAKLDLNASAWVLSRNPEAFRAKAPHLAANPAIQFHPGDIRSFEFPPGAFSHVIHAASEVNASGSAAEALRMFDTVLEGTRQALEFSRSAKAQKFLLTSSGAVYGRQPPELSHVPEDYNGGPSPLETGSAYHEGKRAAELLCALYNQQYGLQTKIARCFAFVGPYLPLEAHLAIGNFIRDGLSGGPIRLQGDGTPVRSYLYAADLAIWLWTILFQGQTCRAYNVGAQIDLPLREVAQMVAGAFVPRPAVEVAKAPASRGLPERYVPNTKRAEAELSLREQIRLPEAIARTIRWYRRNG